MNKMILGVRPNPPGHWVGDGFPVRSLFSYDGLGREALSPFLMLDYAAPASFSPSLKARGVGEHPHRGFETVTIVYSGEVAHRDSAGNSGLIGPGDVQWMTAASGILHDEFHSPAFTSQGGVLEMAQLWVNLPARHKMAPPRYQTILQSQIPEVMLPGARVRVIAGSLGATSGPALTFSEINVWDVRLLPGADVTLPVPAGHNAAIALLRGTLNVNGVQRVAAPAIVVLDVAGDVITVSDTGTASGDSGGAQLLLLSGVPLDEPVVGYGPFVMNSRAEIEAAMRDFQAGRFGRMPAVEHALAE